MTTTREYSREEVARLASKERALLVIDNVVYDVTAWLDEHPGGTDALLDNAGRDASQCFHDVGHSEDAKEWMRRYVVGAVCAADRRAVVVREARAPPPPPLTLGALLRAAWPPVAMAAVALCLYSYLF